jgi:hypothetical protein
MTKRIYYTDPIKAAYMSKEFGVRFSKENIIDDKTYIFWQINPMFTIFSNDTVTLELIDKHCVKLYVAKESEGIFNIKAGDFVTNSFKQGKSRHCHGFAGHPNGLSDTSIAVTTPERHNGKTYFVENISELSIIMRDNKQFFMGEIEND